MEAPVSQQQPEVDAEKVGSPQCARAGDSAAAAHQVDASTAWDGSTGCGSPASTPGCTRAGDAAAAQCRGSLCDSASRRRPGPACGGKGCPHSPAAPGGPALQPLRCSPAASCGDSVSCGAWRLTTSAAAAAVGSSIGAGGRYEHVVPDGTRTLSGAPSQPCVLGTWGALAPGPPAHPAHAITYTLGPGPPAQHRQFAAIRGVSIIAAVSIHNCLIPNVRKRGQWMRGKSPRI